MILFLTDLHLDNYLPFSRILENGMNSRLLDQLTVVKKVAAYIEQEKPEAIIYLGDLYNGITESLPKIIYNAGFLAVQAWSRIAPLYVIVGNHDIYRNMHILNTFETLPNVHIISHTTKIKIGGYEIDMIPWENSLPKEKGDVCAGHLEVHGTTMDAAQKKICEAGIQPTDFFGYAYVLLGHFHTPQTFTVPGAREACYIGSIMQMDRRRSPESFMGVVKLEENQLIGYPIESPRIYDVTIKTQEEMERFNRDVLVRSEPIQHYYKCTITSPEVDFSSPPYNVSVEYHLPEIITSRLQMEGASKETTWTDKLQAAVEAFIDSANTVLDKDELKKLAKELL